MWYTRHIGNLRSNFTKRRPIRYSWKGFRIYVFSDLMRAHDVLSRNNICRNAAARRSTANGIVGRPSLQISKDQIEYLMDCNFTVREISEILNVSKRTVERRLSTYGLTAMNTFTEITNKQLDNVVRDNAWLWFETSCWISAGNGDACSKKAC